MNYSNLVRIKSQSDLTKGDYFHIIVFDKDTNKLHNRFYYVMRKPINNLIHYKTTFSCYRCKEEVIKREMIETGINKEFSFRLTYNLVPQKHVIEKQFISFLDKLTIIGETFTIDEP